MASGQAVAGPGGGVGTITIPPKANNKVKVNPFRLGKSDYATIQFVNQTGGTVGLWIPNGGLVFEGGDQNNDIAAVLRNGKPYRLTVLPDPKEGEYRYSAFCEAIPGFAEGGSAPVIIVH